MPDKVIGIINYLGPNGEIGETQDFTDVNEYLSGIEKAFDEFNILYRVNKEIDAWRTSVNEEDRVKHYGAAERFAKVAANAIIANVQGHGSNENQFFIDTARGMITGFILLVAIYAPPTARHIISVFELIVQCSAPESLPVPGAPQRTMIASLMEHINDRRIRNYVAPASSADIRTALNIFSSALSHLLKFVDAEIEQLICDQSPEFDAQRFIDQPTAIFLICPDENPTRHFLASLFVRSFTDELIELAETKYNETLPRKFLYFLDEFGNMLQMRGMITRNTILDELITRVFS